MIILQLLGFVTSSCGLHGAPSNPVEERATPPPTPFAQLTLNPNNDVDFDLIIVKGRQPCSRRTEATSCGRKNMNRHTDVRSILCMCEIL